MIFSLSVTVLVIFYFSVTVNVISTGVSCWRVILWYNVQLQPDKLPVFMMEPALPTTPLVAKDPAAAANIPTIVTPGLVCTRTVEFILLSSQSWDLSTKVLVSFSWMVKMMWFVLVTVKSLFQFCCFYRTMLCRAQYSSVCPFVRPWRWGTLIT